MSTKTYFRLSSLVLSIILLILLLGSLPIVASTAPAQSPDPATQQVEGEIVWKDMTRPTCPGYRRV